MDNGPVSFFRSRKVLVSVAVVTTAALTFSMAALIIFS